MVADTARLGITEGEVVSELSIGATFNTPTLSQLNCLPAGELVCTADLVPKVFEEGKM